LHGGVLSKKAVKILEKDGENEKNQEIIVDACSTGIGGDDGFGRMPDHIKINETGCSSST